MLVAAKVIIGFGCLISITGLKGISAGKFTQFPEEVLEDDQDFEELLKARAEHAAQICNKYSEQSQPESLDERLNLFFMHYKGEKQLPIGEAIALDGVVPKIQICTPKQSDFAAGVKGFSDQIAQEFPSKVKGNKNDTDLIKKRLKVLMVSHPLERLVRAFDLVSKTMRDPTLDTIKKAYGKFNFKEFVDFILNGGKKFKRDPEFLVDWPLASEWAPFYENCPVCNPDLSPFLVLKSGANFEFEFEVLQDVFGLDDIEIPKFEQISDTMLKMMYSQIGKEQLDQLCDTYRIDMDMFRYSPEKFYSISNLGWNRQFASLVADLNRRMGLVKRLLHWIPRSQMKPVIEGLIMSKLRYGLPIFGQIRLTDQDCQTGNMKQVQVFLNKLMRLLAHKCLIDKVPTVELSQLTGIQSANKLCATSMLQELNCAQKGNLALSEILSTSPPQHSKYLRSTQSTAIPLPPRTI
eukprot:maker-scaffold287_size221780-snap-gene-1.30 protein:Tk01904 transcript:maker-scaffold287_size221780-snap-gene-1.30-mRNA-1 annotation:"carbohydrate sulfotransferase 11"